MHIEITSDRRDEFTSEPGLFIGGETWRVDIDHYAAFIQEVTGIQVGDEAGPPDCYRIGNRLQGFIEDLKKRDAWNSEGISNYPVVESKEEVFWLAEFFRECHSCCIDNSGGEGS